MRDSYLTENEMMIIIIISIIMCYSFGAISEFEHMAHYIKQTQVNQ